MLNFLHIQGEDPFISVKEEESTTMRTGTKIKKYILGLPDTSLWVTKTMRSLAIPKVLIQGFSKDVVK